MTYHSVLLASHGTHGAQAAEALAISRCSPGGTLHHLLVVPDFWKGMMGDDWLNNVRTRISFGNYLEGQLSQEIAQHLQRLSDACDAEGLKYRPEVRQGDPANSLGEYAGEIACDLVVIGAPRPKGSEGLRSRLALDPLLRMLSVPLLVAPHSHV